MRETVKSLIGLAALLSVGALLLAIPAFAHSKMSKSVPADGGTAKVGLETLQLGFSQPVRVTVVKVHHGDDAIEVPATVRSSGFQSSVEVGVAPLAAGTYRVDWTALAKDGHVMTGTVSFTATP